MITEFLYFVVFLITLQNLMTFISISYYDGVQNAFSIHKKKILSLKMKTKPTYIQSKYVCIINILIESIDIVDMV